MKVRAERNGQVHLLPNPMAKVTYRGVSYDTTERKTEELATSEMTYRGVKYNRINELGMIRRQMIQKNNRHETSLHNAGKKMIKH